MLGLVVFGLRTWMCTMAAPALAASIAESAICLGVTGTAGLRPGVSAEPVTAHEIITLRCIASPQGCPPRSNCLAPRPHWLAGAAVYVEPVSAWNHLK